MELPPEDQADVVNVGPIHGVPIIHEDDPRFVQERQAWSAAMRIAQALHTPDELLDGLRVADWRVRHEVVDRLVVRVSADSRTLPALLAAATNDPAWQVRDAVVMGLGTFELASVQPVLRAASSDESSDVRWAAAYTLSRFGVGATPAPM